MRTDNNVPVNLGQHFSLALTVSYCLLIQKKKLFIPAVTLTISKLSSDLYFLTYRALFLRFKSQVMCERIQVQLQVFSSKLLTFGLRWAVSYLFLSISILSWLILLENKPLVKQSSCHCPVIGPFSGCPEDGTSCLPLKII